MLQYIQLLMLCCFVGSVVNVPATNCPVDCNTDTCLCSSKYVPYGWAVGEPPQMIYVIFEGSLSKGNYPPYYQPLFKDLINPNNCPVTGTFFIDHEYTDYTEVHQAWLDGHDIAVQSITNTPFSGESVDLISDEIGGQAYYLNQYGLLNNTYVYGAHPPQSSYGGDNQLQAIVNNNFRYDATLVSRSFDAPFWPYTLDYLTTQDCQNGPCPTQSYPGLLEFPVTDLQDGNGNLCNNLLQCVYNNSMPNAHELLTNNYAYHVTQTTPFLIPTPLGWLFDTNNLNGLRQFLTEAIAGGAYVIGLNRAYEWFKAPTKLADIGGFEPWACDVPRTGGCSGSTCNYNISGQSISMGICMGPQQSSCPTDYPWINNLPF
ncbi:Cytidine deaminase 5 [Chamberlinius hualienensis]